jgi:hypothetical protein
VWRSSFNIIWFSLSAVILQVWKFWKQMKRNWLWNKLSNGLETQTSCWRCMCCLWRSKFRSDNKPSPRVTSKNYNFFLFKFLHDWLIPSWNSFWFFSVGRLTNICDAADNFKTFGAYASMFCKDCSVFDGEGKGNIIFNLISFLGFYDIRSQKNPFLSDK